MVFALELLVMLPQLVLMNQATLVSYCGFSQIVYSGEFAPILM